MKKLVGLGIVLALFVLASPAVAGPRPFCEFIQGTSCSSPGSSVTCVDVCGYTYSCSCTYWAGHYYWSCPYTC